jgi:hypothetical protein
LAVSVRELIHIVADSSKKAPLRVELADVDGPGATVQFDAAPVAAELTDLKRTPVYGPSTRNSCTPSSASFLMKENVPPLASAMMCIADASWSVPNRSARA